MNTVNIAAMNTNVSVKKLLMKDLNFDVHLSHLVAVILFSWYWSIKSLSITEACINLELNWKDSKEIGNGCLKLVQFLLMEFLWFHLILPNSLQIPNLQESTFLDLVFSCSPHAASDSNRKLLSASMSQLHKMFLSS